MTYDIDKLLRQSKLTGILGIDSDPIAFGLGTGSFLTEEMKQAKMLTNAVGAAGSLAKMVEDAGLSNTREVLGMHDPHALSATRAFSLRTDDITSLVKVLAGLRDIQIPRLGVFEHEVSALNSVCAMVREMGLLTHSNGLNSRSRTDALSSYSSILALTRGLGLTVSEMAGMGSIGLEKQLSALSHFGDIRSAIDGLPDWMRPLSTAQAFQPSWEVAAGLGLTSLGRQGLIRDVLGAVHSERAPTAGFEATVQMFEVADENDPDLSGRVLVILRTYAAIIIDRLANATERVTYANFIATLTLLFQIASWHDGRIQRSIAEVSATPSAAQREIQQHLVAIHEAMSQSQKTQALSRDERVVVRSASLRPTPDANGLILRQIYPDDRVHVVGIKGGWAKVEVYEYNSEKVTEGWINRRVLRIPSL